MKKLPHSIQFRFTAGFMFCVIMLSAAVIVVMQLNLRSKLDSQTRTLIESNSRNLIAELERQTTLINTLAQNIAQFAVEAPRDENLFKQVIASMLAMDDEQDLIAGGGYWPEPERFQPGVVRRSFYWGLDSRGELTYFDDYNDPDGPGYHNEEWYVPTRHQRPGECYWSRSYIDPYSQQPMVTCSVGVFDALEYIGVVTVDLKLEGLAGFFERQTELTGGYAFLVDQNNKFITFPDQTLSKYDNHMLFSSDLARRMPAFAPIADSLDAINQDFIEMADRAETNHGDMYRSIEQASYQINSKQAKIILASLIYPDGNFRADNPVLHQVSVADDVVSGESSTAYIYLVPNTYWKLVISIPDSITSVATSQVMQSLMGWLLVPALLIMTLMFFMIRRMVISPIGNITNQLKRFSQSEIDHYQYIEHHRDDELGQLAFWYNHRTVELKEAMESLSAANKDLEYQASFDHLTGLPNRRQFDLELQEIMLNALWSDKALLYIDIDQFKVINDTIGHPVGDQLLIRLGRLLRKQIHEDDIVARIGGDEFAVLLTTATAEDAMSQARDLCRAVENLNFFWDNKHFDTTCSIGVAHLSDIDHQRDNALSIVDKACYVAKDNGRNQAYLYCKHDQLVAERDGEMNWLPLIQKAFRQQQFFLEFQTIEPTRPRIIDKDSAHSRHHRHQPIAIEALVRIRGDNGQIIPPGAFLPAAERYNAIVQIDHLVIDMVLKTLSQHPELTESIDFCSFNLSADTLSDDILHEYIQSCVEKYQVPPDKLCIEVTESKVMSNIVRAQSTLSRLQKMGMRVALDDFGAGMSSYGYLSDLPIDLIKIDGRFVRNIRRDSVNQIFVRSIIEIAHEMKLKTVAEYVTDELTLNVLRDMGVDYVQGFGITRPVSIDQIQNLVDRQGLRSIPSSQ